MSKIKAHSRSSTQHGFTLIEMLVISPILILFIAGFIGTVVTMVGSILASNASSTMTYNIQDALNRIESDVKQSGAILATNNLTITSPQGYNGDTTNFENTYNSTTSTPNSSYNAGDPSDSTGAMLILNAYATTTNPVNLTTLSPIPAAGEPNACGSATVAQNTLTYINIVYFVRNNSLFRRVLVPPNYATIGCSTPWQQASCASGHSSTFCKTNDEDLVDGITSGGFSLNYYPTAKSTTADTVVTNASNSDATRAAEMLAINTVGVSITANQVVAGRTVTQVGSIRATSANNDVTSTATGAAPVITAAPTNQSAASGATATFTATATPSTGATYQWQQSVTNGGTWTVVPGGNSTSLALPSVTPSMSGTLYRIVVSDSVGTITSSAATLSVTAAGWTPVSLQNGWSNYGQGYDPAGFRLTSSGLLVLQGLIQRTGTAVSGEIIGILPVGDRPASAMIFENSSDSTGGRIDVWPDGTIRFQIGDGTWYSLDGISFMPSSYTYTPINGLINSWTSYPGPTYTDPVGYYQASDKRVSLTGLVTGGGVADGTGITTLPAALSPLNYEHILEDNSNLAQAVGIGASGSSYVYAKNYTSNGYITLQALFYPSAYSSGYTALPLQNSWSAYGGVYSTPAYIKSADGLVMLKGLIHSGTIAAGTVIATLPYSTTPSANYCPSSRVLESIAEDSASTGAPTWGRVDILPWSSGATCSVVAEIVSTTWTSLDSISFLPN